MPRTVTSRFAPLLAFAALGLMLRVAVPVGLMPADGANGWYLQLCPDGLPANVAAALLGDGGDGHQHHHHHHTDVQAEPAPEFAQCDLGGGLGAAAACGVLPSLLSNQPAEDLLAPFAPVAFVVAQPRRYETRASPMPT